MIKTFDTVQMHNHHLPHDIPNRMILFRINRLKKKKEDIQIKKKKKMYDSPKE